jgi:hypothetical protein
LTITFLIWEENPQKVVKKEGVIVESGFQVSGVSIKEEGRGWWKSKKQGYGKLVGK